MKWFFGSLNLIFVFVAIPIFRYCMKQDFQNKYSHQLKQDRWTIGFLDVYLGLCFCIGIANAIVWFIS